VTAIDQKAFMKKIIKFLAVTIFGFFISLILLNGIEIDWKSFFISHTLKSDSKVQLYIRLNSTLSDFPESNSFSFGRGLRPCLWDIDQGLRAAAEDPRITSVLLHIESARITATQAYTLGDAIKYFRSTRKTVKCYSSSFSSDNGGFPPYFVATYCNEIVLQRFGQVRIELLKYLDARDESYSDMLEGESGHLSMHRKNVQEVNAIIRTHRGVSLPRLGAGNPYIDTQALNIGLIDSIVPRIEKEECSIVIQDYTRLIKNTQENKVNVVAVIPIPDANIDDAFDIVQKRSEVRSIVVSVSSADDLEHAIQTIDSIPKNAPQKPIVIYVAGPEAGNVRIMSYPPSLKNNVQSVRTLNNAIEVATKLAGSDTLKIRSEVIQTGSLAANFIKDLVEVGRSMKKIFNRSLDHVIQMAYSSD
jgi:hypothetical protein